MLRNLIVLPDGTELFSGLGSVNALQSVTMTQQVNTGTELTLGSACANMLEATIITPAGGLTVAAGTEITLYKVSDDGARTKVGLFTTEKPVRPSANLCKITAYDRVSWLDRELGQWLASLNGWPYTLFDFAKMVCTACNLTLTNESLPNGDWQIQKFSACKVTGRQLMRWVGQACGRFCRANANGDLELAWYTPKDTVLTQEYPILSVSFADYQVAPVDKVQIRMSETDVGAIFGTGSNGYSVTGNYLLRSDTQLPLQNVAQTLYDILHEVTYTPCKVTIPANTHIQAGDVLHLTDRNGNTICFYVMRKRQTGQMEVLECTGSANRNSVTAMNNGQFSALEGKVLELQVGIEGIRAENRDAAGKLTALEMNVEGLTLQVQSVNSEGVAKVSTTTGYTFDENGITVEKSGQEIKTQITEDGMRVYKNKKEMLTADSEGVKAVDLHASTYLSIGGRSRFENYETDRTGCFWIGG